MAIRVSFLHRNIWDTVVILENGKLFHPQFPHCDMLLLWVALNFRHSITIQCTKGIERKRRRLAVEKIRARTERAFQVYGRPLNSVPLFKYLGWIMMTSDDDWTAVVDNPRKDRKSWDQLSRILVWEGDNPYLLGVLFKAVVQSVLVFGPETWMMNPHMVRALGGFHNRVSIQITGSQPQQLLDISWEYPPLDTAIQEAGFEEVRLYLL